MKFIVEIFYRKNIFDAFGHEVEKSIKEIGLERVEKVLVADLYCFEGNINPAMVREITEEVLLDNVSQQYCINRDSKKGKNLWIVEVWFKKGVTDMVAETTKKAINDYGITEEINVSTGKKYYIYGKLTEDEIIKISERILANTLIQNYLIRREKDEICTRN